MFTTNRTRAPIPTRKMDWVAYFADCEEDGQYGYGATEKEAIEDLLTGDPDYAEMKLNKIWAGESYL